MIIPITEALARFAAAAGITGLTGWPADEGEGAGACTRLEGADWSCISLTLL
jgi:hypothetical protein